MNKINNLNNDTLSKTKLSKEMVIPMTYKDVINNDGWRIPLNVWKKSFDDVRIRELLNMNMLYLIDPDKYYYVSNNASQSMNKDNSIGIITSIDLDKRECKVKLWKEYENMNISEMEIFIAYNATFSDIVNVNNGFNHDEIINAKIIAFTLKNKKLSSYNN